MQPDAAQLIQKLASDIGPLTPGTAIVGIHTGGAWVAVRLHRLLKADPALLGFLAVTLHRDDFSQIGLHPQKQSTSIPFTVDGRDILLVDDVLHSGRTVRAALNELFDFGRPARVRLACLIDRGVRALPIAADFTGAKLELPEGEEWVLTQSGERLAFEVCSMRGKSRGN